MDKCKPLSTPAVPLSEGKEKMRTELPKNVPFRQAVGGLLFLSSKARPGIAYAVSIIAASQQTPQWRIGPEYVGSSATSRQHRQPESNSMEELLFLLLPSVMQTSPETLWSMDRRSRSGYVVLMAGAPIDWLSKKQGLVALSTAEAEYIARSQVSQEITYVKQLYGFVVGEEIQTPINIFGDNIAAINIVDKPSKTHNRSKHISIKFHHVRERVEEQEIVFHWIPSGENTADIFTKALARVLFRRFASRLLCEKGGVPLAFPSEEE